MGAFGCKNWFLGANQAQWVQHRAFVLLFAVSPTFALSELFILQDKGDNQVIHGTDTHADGHCHEQQTVEQGVTLFLLIAGTKNQGTAGGEGADGGALCAQHGAGKQGDGADAGGNSQRGNQEEQSRTHNTGGGAEEAHQCAHKAEGQRNQEYRNIGADPCAEHIDGTGGYGNGDQHTGTGDHQDGVPGYDFPSDRQAERRYYLCAKPEGTSLCVS